MAELKTKLTGQSVESFLNSIPDEKKRQDSFAILDVMKQATQAEPKMWGESIVGFVDTLYKYENGREMDWFLVGFSPRKQNLTLYLMGGFTRFEDMLQKLGKHKLGKGCLYINKFEDIDSSVLKQLIVRSVEQMNTP